MAQLPLASFMMVLIAWCIGTFVGALVAASIARTNRKLCAMLVAVGIVLSGVATMVMFPHPVWFWVASIVLPFLCAMAAARLRPDAAIA